MNTIIETLETRTLMSGTIAADAPEPEPIALLVPAVQAAREAARKSTTVESSTLLASSTGTSSHSGGINVLLADGSVRGVGGANFVFADGSVRFVSDSISVSG